MASEDPLVISRRTGGGVERKTVARFQQKQATQSTPDWRRCRPIVSHRPPHNSHQRTISAKIQCQHHLISCEAVKW